MYIYRFLNNQNEIIYIGRTKNIKQRMEHHLGNRSHLNVNVYKELNSIEYCKLNNSNEMYIYEIYLINKYSPKYNTQYNSQAHLTFELPELTWTTYEKTLNSELLSYASESYIKVFTRLIDLETVSHVSYNVFFKLITNMSLDGKNRVLLGKNKKEITEKINLNHKTFNKALKELEEKKYG